MRRHLYQSFTNHIWKYVYHTKFILYAIIIRVPFRDIWHFCVVVELMQLFESNTQHLCHLCNAILTLLFTLCFNRCLFEKSQELYTNDFETHWSSSPICLLLDPVHTFSIAVSYKHTLHQKVESTSKTTTIRNTRTYWQQKHKRTHADSNHCKIATKS